MEFSSLSPNYPVKKRRLPAPPVRAPRATRPAWLHPGRGLWYHYTRGPGPKPGDEVVLVVNVKGVGGVPEPAPGRTKEVEGRARKRVQDEPAKDGVRISAEAQQAAQVSRLVQLAQAEPDIRADRVAEAKARLERGDYQQRDVVEQVAARVGKLIP